jgi:hypothetical protein
LEGERPWRASVPASRAWRRGLPRGRRPAAPDLGHVLRGEGLPSPVAGRSLRASCPALTACPLRSGILPALAPTARLSGHGQPLPGPPGGKRTHPGGKRTGTPPCWDGKRTGMPRTPGARSLWRASVPASRAWRRGLPHARRPAAPDLGHVLRGSMLPARRRMRRVQVSCRGHGWPGSAKGWLTGFEPATPGTTNRCSNRLSYSHRKRHGRPGHEPRAPAVFRMITRCGRRGQRRSSPPA